MADVRQNDVEEGLLTDTDFMKIEDENDLYILLIAVLKELQTTHVLEDTTVEKAFLEIKNQQDNGWGNHVYTDINYNDIVKCCAYLSFYAPCHTALVRHGILWFYEQIPPKIYNDIFGRETLNIVCAGGGPGNDFLGFCCAMQNLPRLFRKLHLTIIDLKASWKNIVDSVMSKAQSRGAGKVNQFLQNVQFTYNFVTADLRHDDVNALKQADLILMAKVLSNVSRPQRLIIIKNVTTSIKTGAIVVCIDVPLLEVEELVTLHLNDVKILASKYYEEFRDNISSPVKNGLQRIRFSNYRICVLQKIHSLKRKSSFVHDQDRHIKISSENEENLEDKHNMS